MTTNNAMMYLPPDKWSSRYDEQFYTVRVSGYRTLDGPHQRATVKSAGGGVGVADAYCDDEAGGEDDDGDDGDCLAGFGFCNPNRARHPAVYYEIEVSSGTRRWTCLRRYSQFRRLCRTLEASSSSASSSSPRGGGGEGFVGAARGLPPRTGPFRGATDEFLEGRREALGAFLGDLLARPECAGNPSIERFLELRRGGD